MRGREAGTAKGGYGAAQRPRQRGARDGGAARTRAAGARLPLRFAALAGLIALLVVPSGGCGTQPQPDDRPGERAETPRVSKAPPTSGSPSAAPAAERSPAARAQPARAARQPVATSTRPAARIAFVNVGQGDAILIKSGGADVLVDGGPQGSARRVGAAMRILGIRDLDTIVVTHAHADHAGAADELARSYDPERVLVAGRCDDEVSRAARSAGARVLQARAGDVYRWGSVSARVLSPSRLTGDANADSLVLLLEVAGRRILLTGDLTGPNEDRVARLCARGPDLYALKVAHHGSRFSTSASFLAATEPRVAIISTGENGYGHPAWQTLRRLQRAGARIYTTRRNGTVTLTIAPSGAVKWRFTRSAKPRQVRG